MCSLTTQSNSALALVQANALLIASQFSLEPCEAETVPVPILETETSKDRVLRHLFTVTEKQQSCGYKPGQPGSGTSAPLSTGTLGYPTVA